MNYRLRILLHAGAVDWPASRPPGTSHPSPRSILGDLGVSSHPDAPDVVERHLRALERTPGVLAGSVGGGGRRGLSMPPGGPGLPTPLAA